NAQLDKMLDDIKEADKQKASTQRANMRNAVNALISLANAQKQEGDADIEALSGAPSVPTIEAIRAKISELINRRALLDNTNKEAVNQQIQNLNKAATVLSSLQPQSDTVAGAAEAKVETEAKEADAVTNMLQKLKELNEGSIGGDEVANIITNIMSTMNNIADMDANVVEKMFEQIDANFWNLLIRLAIQHNKEVELAAFLRKLTEEQRKALLAQKDADGKTPVEILNGLDTQKQYKDRVKAVRSALKIEKASAEEAAWFALVNAMGQDEQKGDVVKTIGNLKVTRGSNKKLEFEALSGTKLNDPFNSKPGPHTVELEKEGSLDIIDVQVGRFSVVHYKLRFNKAENIVEFRKADENDWKPVVESVTLDAKISDLVREMKQLNKESITQEQKIAVVAKIADIASTEDGKQALAKNAELLNLAIYLALTYGYMEIFNELYKHLTPDQINDLLNRQLGEEKEQNTIAKHLVDLLDAHNKRPEILQALSVEGSNIVTVTAEKSSTLLTTLRGKFELPDDLKAYQSFIITQADGSTLTLVLNNEGEISYAMKTNMDGQIIL
ncbi:hypothetical protein ACFL4A_05000, partial [bacterium]